MIALDEVEVAFFWVTNKLPRSEGQWNRVLLQFHAQFWYLEDPEKKTLVRLHSENDRGSRSQ